MKYIIVKSHDLELGIMFDEILTHKQVAGDRYVVSAGYCDAQGKAYGESITLGIESRPQDTEILQQSLTRHI